MNATSTISTNSSALNAASGLREVFRAIGAGLRRALELHIEAYSHGIAPPM